MHCRLGVVAFLNSRPLTFGLSERDDVTLTPAVPAELPGLLDRGAVDIALVPLIDILRQPDEYAVVSDGCIASDGETMTVRVFSQVPPDRVRILVVDTDSHTSVVLARVLWRELYGQTLTVRPADAARTLGPDGALLLIGDKVVDPHRGGYAQETDLGAAWRQHTGLPFVFAVWAARRNWVVTHPRETAAAAELLGGARDAGVASAVQIAREWGPQHGWPIELAERYLLRCLKFTLNERMVAGVNRFAELARAADLLPAGDDIVWPALVGAES